MPHTARKLSASGYYHVVPKGIHNQVLFETDEDRRKYLGLLQAAKKQYGVAIHAYCLMDNHIHLVLESAEDGISSFMKYVDERYGAYFAETTGRKGGIFVRPLWSEPIECDEHLLCAIRYVHANPAAAGMCPASAYEWSSAKDYLGRRGITDTQMVLDLLGGREGFIAWSRSTNATAHPFPGSTIGRHLSDNDLGRIASSIICRCVDDLKTINLNERTPLIQLLVQRGIPVAALSRLSGLSRKEIYVSLGH